jgi:hypothetical protein
MTHCVCNKTQCSPSSGTFLSLCVTCALISFRIKPSNIFRQRVTTFLWAGLRGARVKITISGTPIHLNCCVTVIVCEKRANVAAYRNDYAVRRWLGGNRLKHLFSYKPRMPY